MALLILLILGFIVLSWCAGGIAVRLIAPLFHIKTTLWRAIASVMASGLAVVLVGVVFSFAINLYDAIGGAVQLVVLGIGGIGVVIVVGVGVMRYVLATSALKAVATWLVAQAAAVAVVILLRIFFWEAFAIPTGSMAPTLFGEHVEVNCPNCGHAFLGDAPRSYDKIETFVCANCLAPTEVESRAGTPGYDRIVTLKTRLPRRWELATFYAPHKPDTTYVSRIAGMPGDTIELAQGDVFINGQREVRPADRYESMWILVNDTALQPKVVDKEHPGWRAADSASPWKQQAGQWTIDAGDAELVFDRQITNFIEYSSSRSGAHDPVNDVRMDVRIESLTGQGDLSLIWQLADREVTARFTASGEATLSLNGAANNIVEVAGDKPRDIGLAVRDGVASLLVGGQAMAIVVVDAQGIERHRKSVNPEERDFCRLSIRTKNVAATLGRIMVRRDVHYTAPRWGDCNGCTNNAMALGPREYFVLGDNSDFAYDSRAWSSIDPSVAGDYQIGALPEEMIRSVVHWVYWPLRRARTIE